MMHTYADAYLFRGKTVVTDKKDIQNATDDEFQKVYFIVSDKFVEKMAKEFQKFKDDKEIDT